MSELKNIRRSLFGKKKIVKTDMGANPKMIPYKMAGGMDYGEESDEDDLSDYGFNDDQEELIKSGNRRSESKSARLASFIRGAARSTGQVFRRLVNRILK